MASSLPPLGTLDTGRDTPDMAWDGWGPPERRRHLPAAARPIIARYLHAEPSDEVQLTAEDVELPPSALAAPGGAADLAALTAIVGTDHVHTDHTARLLHAGGKSLTNLLTRRRFAHQLAPDAVVRPADHDQTQRVIEACSARRIAVVPFGGGTSVVGGVDADGAGFTATISLDLGRLTALHDLDEKSQTATLGAGLAGPEAERLLGERGYVIGHYPQSFEHATLGGFAASRSSGQASSGYGRFDSLVEWLRLATPAGTWDLGRAPASAAGPDLRQLVLGSEGAFGAITALRLRIRPAPQHVRYEAWAFPTFEQGADAVRLVAQSGLRPTVLRLSDQLETRINFALAGDVLRAARRRCLAITTYEGPSRRETELRRRAVATIFGAHDGAPLGPAIARDWEKGRYKAPFWRDPALDAGVIVETFETATSWSDLVGLWRDVTRAVRAALTEGKGRALVWAHISHQYPTGASLYFTAVAPMGADPIGLWRGAKLAAAEQIVAHGATITHHHAVGRDHLPWLTDEIGPLGVEVLRAVKRTLDPAGICNPGVLVPPAAPSGLPQS